MKKSIPEIHFIHNDNPHGRSSYKKYPVDYKDKKTITYVMKRHSGNSDLSLEALYYYYNKGEHPYMAHASFKQGVEQSFEDNALLKIVTHVAMDYHTVKELIEKYKPVAISSSLGWLKSKNPSKRDLARSHRAIKAASDLAKKYNILFLKAAGNEGYKFKKKFLNSINLSHFKFVQASDDNGAIADYSNSTEKNIASLRATPTVGTKTENITGTSFSAPYLTGLLAGHAINSALEMKSEPFLKTVSALMRMTAHSLSLQTSDNSPHYKNYNTMLEKKIENLMGLIVKNRYGDKQNSLDQMFDINNNVKIGVHKNE